jgi:hypothetical protein
VGFPADLSNGCIVAVIQRKRLGSTWVLEEEFLKYRTVQRFWYDAFGTIDTACCSAVDWCEMVVDTLARYTREQYARPDLKRCDDTADCP